MSSTNNNKQDETVDEDGSVVTQSFPPSHILEDGRYIYLPPPNEFERSKCFERAISKYGLLESDMTKTTKQQQKEDEKQQQEKKGGEDDDDEKDKTAPKVHPLAAASARLQGNGISELNRAINLSTLVNTGEYFGLSNIVDPSLELIGPSKEGPAAAPASAAASSDATGGGAGPATPGPDKGGTSASAAAAASTPTPGAAAAASASAALSTQAQKELQEEQRVKSAYVLKRKRAVFDKASRVLQRHQARLQAAVTAQSVPDQRLRQLRSQWRLVAPEHGTRAKPHAVRPTEVVAVDVDVYDPTGGGGSSFGTSLVGRLASQVPRFATVELTDDYAQRRKEARAATAKAKADAKQEDVDASAVDTVKAESEGEDKMEIDSPVKKEAASGTTTTTDKKQSEKDGNGTEDARKYSDWTMAEPFAIADPTLGKISTDFDPSKVAFLTLQFDIEKPSTGFCMSSCLEPMTTTTIGKLKKQKKNDAASSSSAPQKEGDDAAAKKSADKDDEKGEEDKTELDDNENAKDEQVLVSLQHSLFCAKLFEAIRRELMGDEGTENESPAQQRQQQQRSQAAGTSQTPSHHSIVWLASESEENFLPPPSVMVRPTTNSTGAALCVVHCHASEVKVQLDSEYTLRAKLVEANDQQRMESNANTTNDSSSKTKSGSQSPEQLLVLCRSLLLHAQESYHNHSLHESFEAAKKQREEEEKKLQEDSRPKGLDRIQKTEARKQPKILQTVVGLGTKMLFEKRIRKALVRVRHWLRTHDPTGQYSLRTEWLSLSLFDSHSQFCVSFGTALTIDVTIVRDEMVVTSYGSSTGTDGTGGDYRKVKFSSDAEFEIFLKLEVRRLLRQQKRQAALVAAVSAVAAVQ